ncbi:MAG: aspartyl/glutamyl-tRNA amidotransferase subunit C [Desulfurococcales archaeon]|nr:aspartyl/glutamyl-tRNA amidotransferase subunit C [Desulfurococcales archaeon]
MEDCSSILEQLSKLARIKLSEEDCSSIDSIRSFFARLSKARELAGSVEPLYHVWEVESRLREGEGYGQVNVEELGVTLEEGYVKLPWRGKA